MAVSPLKASCFTHSPRPLTKGGRKGPSGSAVPVQAQKRAPRVENNPSSRVGALPIGTSAPQCSSYADEGVGKTCKKMPLHAMSWHGQRNSPRAHLCQDPSVIYWPWYFGCGRTSVPVEYMLAPSKHPPAGNKYNTWWSYIWSWANVWLELARMQQCQLDPSLMAGHALMATHHHRLGLLWLGIEELRQPSS